jgi:hypothetical protein
VGIAFSASQDKAEAYVPLPGTATIEEARSAAASPYGEMHASLAALLKGRAGGDEEQRAWLRASEAGLERMLAADPVYVQSMAQLLRAVRPFSSC